MPFVVQSAVEGVTKEMDLGQRPLRVDSRPSPGTRSGDKVAPIPNARSADV
jgi:hypothetical protein